MLATGLSALFSCLLYLIMSPCQLQIGFVGSQGNRVVMKMSFQWAFYCVFAVGRCLPDFVGIVSCHAENHFAIVLAHSASYFRLQERSTFVIEHQTLTEPVPIWSWKMACFARTCPRRAFLTEQFDKWARTGRSTHASPDISLDKLKVRRARWGF